MRTFIRTFIVLAVITFASLPLAARSVSPDRARALAGNFLGKSIKPEQTKAVQDEQPYYLFNAEGGGFVIIAGDDSVEPVLGYSDKGSFVTDGMPANIRWWMDMWASQIRINQREGVEADADIKAQWDEMEAAANPLCGATAKLLETALWNQTSPYNSLCPSFGGEQSLTGCVATATAIVMRYFKYPEKGSGTLPDYSYSVGTETRNISGHKLGEVYDWDNMPLEYKGGETSAQNDAVANLMYDLGVMLQMQYDPDGSGASSLSVPAMLKKYMGYDKSSVILFYANYSQDDWISLMKAAIDGTGPFCYSGANDNLEGHEFVVDGYDASSRFHINWGWGGVDNGYFTIGAFKDFKSYQDMVRLIPDEGGSVDSRYLTVISEKNSKGLVCDTQTFNTGVSFNASCNYICNYSMEDFSGYAGLARFSKDGEIKQLLSVTDITLPALTYVGFKFSNLVLNDISIGDYLAIVSSVDGEQWIEAPYDLYDSNLTGVVPIADATSIEEETRVKYTVSSSILQITTKKDVTWTFKTEGGTDASSAASWDETKGVLTIRSGELEPGDYILVLTKAADSKTLKLTF